MISYIGLGSNLGESSRHLKTALKSLHSEADIKRLKISPFYGSKPHGPQDQPDYINAVAEVETSLEPLELLNILQNIENDNHRVRGSQRWTARTLDLDILLYGTEKIQSERLIIPHPRILERPFVLYPLYDIAPTLTFPDGKKLSDYITSIPDEIWVLENKNGT